MGVAFNVLPKLWYYSQIFEFGQGIFEFGNAAYSVPNSFAPTGLQAVEIVLLPDCLTVDGEAGGHLVCTSSIFSAGLTRRAAEISPVY